MGEPRTAQGKEKVGKITQGICLAVYGVELFSVRSAKALWLPRLCTYRTGWTGSRGWRYGSVILIKDLLHANVPDIVLSVNCIIFGGTMNGFIFNTG